MPSWRSLGSSKAHFVWLNARELIITPAPIHEPVTGLFFLFWLCFFVLNLALCFINVFFLVINKTYCTFASAKISERIPESIGQLLIPSRGQVFFVPTPLSHRRLPFRSYYRLSESLGYFCKTGQTAAFLVFPCRDWRKGKKRCGGSAVSTLHSKKEQLT